MTLTADGNTDLTTEPGKEYVFSAAGTFGSGTLTLQWSDGTSFTAFQDASGNVALTAAGARVVVAPTRAVRLVLSGSTAASIIASFLPKS